VDVVEVIPTQEAFDVFRAGLFPPEGALISVIAIHSRRMPS